VRRLLSRASYAEELDDAMLIERAADALAAGRVIGWFQGRMEFGPRALGNRSILASPAAAETKARINSMIKKREWFRPLAPSVLQEHAWEWFDGAAPSPYMSFVARARRIDAIPAVVHVDGTARLQTVRAEDNAMFATLIEAFRRRTGLPLVLNTSLNGPGEPIACSPEDALRTATAIGLDELYLGRHRLVLDAQAPELAAAAGGR
jgi:carbamoyltransferase